MNGKQIINLKTGGLKNTMETYKLDASDVAWIAARLKAHFKAIKKSRRLSQYEKNVEINSLMLRASKFNLDNLVRYFGFIIFVFPISQGREFKLIMPINYTKKDIDIVIKQIDFIKTEQFNPTPNGKQ